MEDSENILHGKLLATSHALLDTAHKLQLPESLPVLPTKDNTVDIARKTLRWLRNLQETSKDMEFWMRMGNLQDQQIKAQWLEKLVTIYAGQVKITQLSDPEMLNHFTIEHANHAAGSLALSTSLHTLEILPVDSSLFPELDKKLDDVLPEWDDRQTQAVEQLIDSIESGLTHLVNKPLGDRSPVDRLIEVSNNLQETVRKLYSIDTLKEPAREESVELAREILRRLKNLSFSDRNIEDAIDTGRPNEKLSFAKKIFEMVDMYKNLLSEAMHTNPKILEDERVKNATDAASDCANGISLLAAKEIPTNTAEVQQISTDLNGIRKNNEGMSLNRLMNKMEGGVEQAAQEISTTKDRSKKIDEEIREQTERLRHRRRRQHQIMLRHIAHRAHQARIQERMRDSINNKTKNVNNLNQLDIAAVRQAGDSLRKNSKQASDILSTSGKNKKGVGIIGGVSDVSANSPLSPDDKNFATRERDIQNNPNHPRNRNRII